MKKILFMLAVVFFIANNSSAQDNNNMQENGTDFRERLLFGLKAGINYSNVYDSEGEEFEADPKLGLVGGFFLAIPIGKYLGFQPEVLYSQKGFRATGMILGNTYEFNRTTSYIDIPLLIQLKPSRFLTLLAGPQYSYLLKQRDVFTNAIMSIEQEQEFKNDNIRKNTLCFLGGFDVNINHFVLGARIGWDLLNNNGDGTSTTPRYKNYWYQVTFGLNF